MNIYNTQKVVATVKIKDCKPGDLVWEGGEVCVRLDRLCVQMS